ncbi:unnamed protein product, partial [Heterosigma akashiwo]
IYAYSLYNATSHYTVAHFTATYSQILAILWSSSLVQKGPWLALAGLKPLDETVRDGNSRPKEGLPEHKAQKIPNRQGHNQEDTLYKPSCDQCVQKKLLQSLTVG